MKETLLLVLKVLVISMGFFVISYANEYKARSLQLTAPISFGTGEVGLYKDCIIKYSPKTTESNLTYIKDGRFAQFTLTNHLGLTSTIKLRKCFEETFNKSKTQLKSSVEILLNRNKLPFVIKDTRRFYKSNNRCTDILKLDKCILRDNSNQKFVLKGVNDIENEIIQATAGPIFLERTAVNKTKKYFLKSLLGFISFLFLLLYLLKNVLINRKTKSH
ncbi:MAG: hypothetical protein BM556_08885 [Bacteriovorax sp. MedPE-SWde]|nr:MAG: hypothetical protein BM556_08885 [Bacteriovorax sp. MedPE-SWde]